MTELLLKKFPNNVTIQVTINLTREYLIRKWIATRLILLAGYILGCEIRFNTSND